MLSKKIGLVLFGLFLTTLILEIGLRIAGFTMLSLQERRNLQSIKQKGVYTIMCLGESTTAGGHEAYPSQLEDILNQQNIGVKFDVINKGIPAVDSNIILSLLEDNLDKYKPDMIVAMMGINDKMSHESADDFVIFLRSMRVYKLIKLLWQNIAFKVKIIELYEAAEGSIGEQKDETLNTYSSYIELGKHYHSIGQYRKAEKIFKKAIEIDPKNNGAYFELRWCYIMQEDPAKAEEMLRKVIELNPDNTWAYFGLGGHYRHNRQYDKAEAMLKKAIEADPKNYKAYCELGRCYRDQKKYEQCEKMFNKAIAINSHSNAYFVLIWDYIKQNEYTKAENMIIRALKEHPKDSRFYNMASIFYERQGRGELAEGYLKRANRIGQRFYNTITAYNYQRLKRIAARRGIKLVCMQYPLRSIEPLEKIMESTGGVIFVENMKIFREALRQEDYDEYFEDMFAGDFGHCTYDGNRLLAENIANVILKECFNNR